MSALLEHDRFSVRTGDGAPPNDIDVDFGFGRGDDSAARRTLRQQISKLERELSEIFVTAFLMGGLEHHVDDGDVGQPRLLDIGELEQIRDDLAERLHAARGRVSQRADQFEANRLLLERMLVEPARYRYARVALRDIGERGCGAYEVRPRLGLVGMLAGWWHVKLSSGCPLAMGRGVSRGPEITTGRCASS
ncbi:MAG TPA: hypothetical protein VG223_10420 [Solirubrobacteraceae bacterium]|jgi:hypothetical protein|nr:hypothetical protein [Solirubrobacteraceae bacterium]